MDPLDMPLRLLSKLSAKEFLFHYHARVTRVIDGDTVVCDIDQGMHDWKHDQRIRLFGINAPEIRGPQKEKGLKARSYMMQLMSYVHLSDIILQTHKDKTGKYGRWLGTLWIFKDGSWVNLNEAMVDGGHAVESR